jgi:hypothetical protein
MILTRSSINVHASTAGLSGEDPTVTYIYKSPLRLYNERTSINRALPASTAKQPAWDRARAVRHTLCELGQNLLLVADAVKQQLDVVVVHVALLPGHEDGTSSGGVRSPASSAAGWSYGAGVRRD